MGSLHGRCKRSLFIVQVEAMMKEKRNVASAVPVEWFPVNH